MALARDDDRRLAPRRAGNGAATRGAVSAAEGHAAVGHAADGHAADGHAAEGRWEPIPDALYATTTARCDLCGKMIVGRLWRVRHGDRRAGLLRPPLPAHVAGILAAALRRRQEMNSKTVDVAFHVVADAPQIGVVERHAHLAHIIPSYLDNADAAVALSAGRA